MRERDSATRRASLDTADAVFANPELRARFQAMADHTTATEPVPDDLSWVQPIRDVLAQLVGCFAGQRERLSTGAALFVLDWQVELNVFCVRRQSQDERGDPEVVGFDLHMLYASEFVAVDPHAFMCHSDHP